MSDLTKQILADIPPHVLRNLNAAQRAAASRQLIDHGYTSADVESVLGPPAALPDPIKEQWAHLKGNWTGPQEILANALSKAGLEK